jgi:tetratricopeptide (TPR) repeat protein
MRGVLSMYPSTRNLQYELRGLRRCRSRVWIVALTSWFLFSSGLLAKTHAGTITGTVKTEAGVSVPHAKVIARASGGQVFSSVLTDDRGRFQFPPIQPGTYRLEVEFPGQLKTSSRMVVVKEGEHAVLNFVATPAQKGVKGQSDLLGPVSFYNHSDFKQSELKNPSGGGGYSNAASTQAVKILNQYLAPTKSPGAESGAGANGNSGAASSSQEAILERSGSALLAKNNYTQAVEVFEKATAFYPRSERSQMGLGLSFFGAGKYPEAIDALREAARLAPGDSAPVVMIAEALQFTQDAAAASLLKRFSELHPENARGRYAYGLSLWRAYRLNHNSEALAGAQSEFERAVALDSNDADAHLQLGMIFDEKKAPDLAIREYREAIRVNPKLATAHYRLARDYERLGAKAKAADEFAQYNKLRGQTSH